MKILARTGATEELHNYSIDLIIKLRVKNKMSLWFSKKEKFFKFFFGDV